jgi:membrane associated rhomboid family serine protease
LPAWVTLLTSMFMYGGWFHLVSNMWFLWLFGDKIEDAMGHARYVAFYLLAGLAAAAAQVLVDPTSSLPMVGASGAISGIMGAYLRLFPHLRVHVWLFMGILSRRMTVPAYLMLGYWFMLQVLGSTVSAVQAEGGGVAFAAHVGGFHRRATAGQRFREPGIVGPERRLSGSLRGWPAHIGRGSPEDNGSR